MNKISHFIKLYKSNLLGASSFFLEQTPFQKGLNVQNRKQEVIKIISFV